MEGAAGLCGEGGHDGEAGAFVDGFIEMMEGDIGAHGGGVSLYRKVHFCGLERGRKGEKNEWWTYVKKIWTWGRDSWLNRPELGPQAGESIGRFEKICGRK